MLVYDNIMRSEECLVNLSVCYNYMQDSIDIVYNEIISFEGHLAVGCNFQIQSVESASSSCKMLIKQPKYQILFILFLTNGSKCKSLTTEISDLG